jgi:transcriptional regulator with XRE-family HTH domain
MDTLTDFNVRCKNYLEKPYAQGCALLSERRKLAHMTDIAQTAVTPAIEVRHRMRIAMEFAGLKPHHMAAALDVSPVTVSRYLNGSVSTSRATVMAWGMRTGVAWQWILDGSEPDNGGDAVTIRYQTDAQVFEFRPRIADLKVA